MSMLSQDTGRRLVALLQPVPCSTDRASWPVGIMQMPDLPKPLARAWLYGEDWNVWSAEQLRDHSNACVNAYAAQQGDYKALLEKYVHLIIAHEGTDYLMYADLYNRPGFTQKEMAELQEIVDRVRHT